MLTTRTPTMFHVSLVNWRRVSSTGDASPTRADSRKFSVSVTSIVLDSLGEGSSAESEASKIGAIEGCGNEEAGSKTRDPWGLRCLLANILVGRVSPSWSCFFHTRRNLIPVSYSSHRNSAVSLQLLLPLLYLFKFLDVQDQWIRCIRAIYIRQKTTEI